MTGFTRKYIKERRFVLTLVRDGASNRSLEEHVRALTEETKDMHPLVELADASELHDLSGLTEDGVAVAGSGEIDRQPHKKDKLAILTSSDEVQNLASKYSATSRYFRADVRVFRDFKSAIDWLGVSDLEEEIDELRK
jgi:hypothetical protein